MAGRSAPRGIGFVVLRPLALDDLLEFVQAAPAVCIYVSGSSVALGNQALLRPLAAKYGEQITFGHIRRDLIDTKSWWFPLLVAPHLRRIGLAADRILPGYYIFREGTLLGWHPGSFGDQADTVLGVAAALYGLFELGHGQSFARAFTSGWKLFDRGNSITAGPAFDFFSQLLDEPFPSAANEGPDGKSNSAGDDGRKRRQSDVFENTLTRAYRVMGIEPSASDEAVKSRYRKLTLERHPDRVRDPLEKVKCEEFMKRLNNAYELIVAERGI